MEEKSIFLNLSPNASKEYCCRVVKINKLTPIEGSDFLATTSIYGTQVVVRKDQVKEGDIMFYAMIETVLNKRFLSENNLYDISNRNLNKNADEVGIIMENYDKNHKLLAQPYKDQANAFKKQIKALTESASKLKKEIKKYEKKLNSGLDVDNINRDEYTNEIAKLQAKADEKISLATSLTVKLTEAKKTAEEYIKSGEHIVNEAKKKCGFFNQYGRVRCCMLQKTPSFGFLFSVEDMAKFNPNVKNINIEDYLDCYFDTVDGELFVKVYVPPVKDFVTPRGSRDRKNAKKVSRFDRIVDGAFVLHYETTPLDTKFLASIGPSSPVSISVKLHGTSVVIGKVLVKEPREDFMGKLKLVWHNIVNKFNLPKILDCEYYNKVYGPVYSSRKVIKNKYINTEVKQGYYKYDVWVEFGDLLYPYLDEGMTVYGEIVGYADKTPIQKNYDYMCNVGESKMMIYRIKSDKGEWNVSEVKEWTEKLIEKNPSLKDKIHVIDLLYNGTLMNLYPDIKIDENWAENTYKRLSEDKEKFGMEDYEPLCNNEVPREGICIRIDNDNIKRCFKLKTMAFKFKEAILIDAGEVDIEMNQSLTN